MPLFVGYLRSLYAEHFIFYPTYGKRGRHQTLLAPYFTEFLHLIVLDLASKRVSAKIKKLKIKLITVVMEAIKEAIRFRSVNSGGKEQAEPDLISWDMLGSRSSFCPWLLCP